MFLGIIIQKISQKRPPERYPSDVDPRSSKRQAEEVSSGSNTDSFQEVAGMVTFLNDVDLD